MTANWTRKQGSYFYAMHNWCVNSLPQDVEILHFQKENSKKSNTLNAWKGIHLCLYTNHLKQHATEKCFPWLQCVSSSSKGEIEKGQISLRVHGISAHEFWQIPCEDVPWSATTILVLGFGCCILFEQFISSGISITTLVQKNYLWISQGDTEITQQLKQGLKYEDVETPSHAISDKRKHPIHTSLAGN